MNYFTRVYWSEQDGCHLAEVPELPGCVADGRTEEEARQHAEESAGRWIEMTQYLGGEIPRAVIFQSPRPRSCLTLLAPYSE